MNTQIYIRKELGHLYTPVKNMDFVKPRGGIWTSTFIDNKKISEWCEWCRSNQNDWVKGYDWFKFHVNKDAKILLINGIDVVKYLRKRFPVKSKIADMFAILDWEKISQYYDGVYLSQIAMRETHMPNDMKLSLYGWDCSSSLWFRNVFDKIEYMGVIKK